jgi:hypothetical protein
MSRRGGRARDANRRVAAPREPVEHGEPPRDRLPLQFAPRAARQLATELADGRGAVGLEPGGALGHELGRERVRDLSRTRRRRRRPLDRHGVVARVRGHRREERRARELRPELEANGLGDLLRRHEACDRPRRGLRVVRGSDDGDSGEGWIVGRDRRHQHVGASLVARRRDGAVDAGRGCRDDRRDEEERAPALHGDSLGRRSDDQVRRRR